MNLSRLMVNAQSIEESKFIRISKNRKRSGPSEKAILGSRRGIQFKMNLGILRLSMIRVVVVKVVRILVLLLGRSTMVNI